MLGCRHTVPRTYGPSGDKSSTGIRVWMGPTYGRELNSEHEPGAMASGHGRSRRRRNGHTDTTWRQFLHAQAATMLATGFFHLPCGLRGDPPAAVLLLRDGGRLPLRPHPRRDRQPDGPWTVQQIRNLLMDLGKPATGSRFLIRDRAGQFSASFDAVLAGAGIETVKIRPRSPKGECLRGAVRAHRPDRGHRPDADLRRTPSAARPSPVRGPLQRPATSSQTSAPPARTRSPCR